MRRFIPAITLMVAFGCKNAGKRPGAADLAAENFNADKPGIENFVGEYDFTGPQTSISRQHPNSEENPPKGVVQVFPDGRVILSVNFYRASRAGSFFEPGVVVSLTPGGQPRTETYTVSSSGFFGGTSSEERMIETIDTIEANEAGKELILVSRTTMSSRPYTWFNKKPWKIYKTRVITLRMAGDTVSFLEKSEDALGKEESALNFTRKQAVGR